MARTNTATGRKPRGRVKPTGLLKELADTKKVDSSLLSDIQAHMLKRQGEPTDRRQDIIHPSEMAKADWCPRSTYYRLAGVTPTNPEVIKFNLENIFDEGHEIHRKWQQRVWDLGRLWGTWKCLNCGNRWEATSPAVCPACERSLIEYREVPLEAEEKYLIAGHEDGADVKTNSLIEIKSIGQGTLRFEDPRLLQKHLVETVDGKKVHDLDGIWKGIKRPLSSHVRQTNIYLALAQEMGLPYDSVTFIYEYKANQQVKAFTVKYAPSIAEPLLDKALDIKYALKVGKTPARPDFAAPDTKTCKGCVFFTYCYKEEPYGATGTAEPDETQGYDGLAASGGRRNRRTNKTSSRVPRSARRPDGDQRRGTDGTAGEIHELAGVHGRQAGSGSGRREVRRRHTRTP